MCNNFQCKNSYLELTSSGSAAAFCSFHKIFDSDCSGCFFHECHNCRSNTGLCSDQAYQYFKGVLANGQINEVSAE